MTNKCGSENERRKFREAVRKSLIDSEKKKDGEDSYAPVSFSQILVQDVLFSNFVLFIRTKLENKTFFAYRSRVFRFRPY